jgi:hypothetical protein
MLRDPVPDPRRWNPHVPRDLVVVLQAALEKDRARRYATALDLAEDLRRVARHEPIHARPPGLALRFLRWTQRSPRLAAATLGLFGALATGLGVALLLLGRLQRENDARQGQVLAGLALSEAKSRPVHALLLAIEAARRSSGEHVDSALYVALDSAYIERVLDNPRPGLVAVGRGRGQGRAFPPRTRRRDRRARLPDPAPRALRLPDAVARRASRGGGDGGGDRARRGRAHGRGRARS